MMILVVLRWLVFGDDHVVVAVLKHAIFYGSRKPVPKSNRERYLASSEISLSSSLENYFRLTHYVFNSATIRIVSTRSLDLRCSGPNETESLIDRQDLLQIFQHALSKCALCRLLACLCRN